MAKRSIYMLSQSIKSLLNRCLEQFYLPLGNIDRPLAFIEHYSLERQRHRKFRGSVRLFDGLATLVGYELCQFSRRDRAADHLGAYYVGWRSLDPERIGEGVITFYCIGDLWAVHIGSEFCIVQAQAV